MNQQQTGLYNKYTVYRQDGRDAFGGDRQDSEYFVLDYKYDPYARVALRCYAEACKVEYPLLAQDLLNDLAKIEEEDNG